MTAPRRFSNALAIAQGAVNPSGMREGCQGRDLVLGE
jgi:hypothetical protein